MMGLGSLFPRDGPRICPEGQLKTDVIRTRLAIEEMFFEGVPLRRRKLVCRVTFGSLRTNRFVVLHSTPSNRL